MAAIKLLLTVLANKLKLVDRLANRLIDISIVYYCFELAKAAFEY